MRKQLFKIASMAVLMLALTSTAFAEDQYNGLRLGFYGALPANPNTIGRTDGAVGALLDLGNNLELGLGLGYRSYSETTETAAGDGETTESAWELIPGISYAIRKGDVASWGAGLNIHLASWSREEKPVAGNKTTTEPDNVDLAFFPNFFMKAEVAKRFFTGLKTGIFIDLPGEDEHDNAKTNRHTINLRTELFFAFFL